MRESDVADSDNKGCEHHGHNGQVHLGHGEGRLALLGLPRESRSQMQGACPRATTGGPVAPIGIVIPRGRINRSMTTTPTQNRTRPTNGWKTLMAMDSPHSLPAKKMKVMRPRLRSQRRIMPPVSQRTLRTMGPRTIAAKAEPTNRKPTTPLTPEQAETMLREKGVPWCVTENSALSDEAAGVARWVHTAILSMASRVRFVKAFSTPSRYFS